jgi:hypothetical protein
MARLLPSVVWAMFVCWMATGCVSKSKADAQARAAFLAGQQHATQQLELRGPAVTVVGEVKNAIVPWTEDLTLAKALVAADYYGSKDPAEIIVVRSGEEFVVDPKNLFGGADIPLLPRDVIELRP